MPARRRTLALIKQVLGLKHQAFLAAIPTTPEWLVDWDSARPTTPEWLVDWDSGAARRLWRILSGRRIFDAPVAFGPPTLFVHPATLLLLMRRTCILVVDIEDVLMLILSRLVALRFLVLGALRCSLLEPATAGDRPRLLARRQ